MFARDVYLDQKTSPFILLAVTLRRFGQEALELEPSILAEEINKTHDIKLSDLQSDKLQAAITVLTTHTFETDWRVFETVVNLFCNHLVDHDLVNPVEAEDIAEAMAEVTIIKHSIFEADEALEFDDEVRAYAGKIFSDYGMFEAPKVFPKAIMPPGLIKADDTNKNESLDELFSARVEYILALKSKLQ